MIQKHRVLMIDDDQLILRAFSRLLKDGDYELLTVSDGEGALKILNQRPVSVVISDEILTTEEGLPVLKTLFANHPCAQKIIFTGWPRETLDWDKIKACKPFAVVAKPDIDNRLRKAICAAIKEYEKQMTL
ncbi:MAG: response regulator [Proteobacteria bacterium]|nr:response regulator [Pseudomonadota bacterium]